MKTLIPILEQLESKQLCTQLPPIPTPIPIYESPNSNISIVQETIVPSYDVMTWEYIVYVELNESYPPMNTPLYQDPQPLPPINPNIFYD